MIFIQVFQTKKQIDVLSDVLENTVFDTNIPFKLTGRAFQLLTDIFLFYDFSVQNFFLSYKVSISFVFFSSFVFIFFVLLWQFWLIKFLDMYDTTFLCK